MRPKLMMTGLMTFLLSASTALAQQATKNEGIPFVQEHPVLFKFLVGYAIIAGVITLRLVRPPLINWYHSTFRLYSGRDSVDIFFKSLANRLGFELFIFAVSCGLGACGLFLVALFYRKAT